VEEKSWRQGRVEARFEGGQGPEGAVAPYIDWLILFWVSVPYLMGTHTTFVWYLGLL
jgi:hypothetical protein